MQIQAFQLGTIAAAWEDGLIVQRADRNWRFKTLRAARAMMRKHKASPAHPSARFEIFKVSDSMYMERK